MLIDGSYKLTSEAQKSKTKWALLGQAVVARAVHLVAGVLAGGLCSLAGLFKAGGGAGVCIGFAASVGAVTGAADGASTSAFEGGNARQQSAAAARGAASGPIFGAVSGGLGYATGVGLGGWGMKILLGAVDVVADVIATVGEIVFPVQFTDRRYVIVPTKLVPHWPDSDNGHELSKRWKRSSAS